MDKQKIIPIVLMVIVVVIGYVAFTFHTQKQAALQENSRLGQSNRRLADENDDLKYKFNKVDKEKDSLEKRLTSIRRELSDIEREKEDFRRKWESASSERDALAEQLQSAPGPMVEFSPEQPMFMEQPAGRSEEDWADFVQKKAALEAGLEDASGAMLEASKRVAELTKENKEMSINIDQLTKEKNILDKELNFKERTMRIMSMDLVAEREERTTAVNEVKNLRGENIDLKRELVLANKDKLKLQDRLKEAVDEKVALARKISEAENVLREKRMAFEELQEDLASAISGGKKVLAPKTASVELPPIVVNPETSSLKGIKGELIAVNHEDKFVVVDIGETVGLRPGTMLTIIRSGKEIGTVEVIETRKDISAADIKQTTSGFSLQEGDIALVR